MQYWTVASRCSDLLKLSGCSGLCLICCYSVKSDFLFKCMFIFGADADMSGSVSKRVASAEAFEGHPNIIIEVLGILAELCYMTRRAEIL